MPAKKPLRAVGADESAPKKTRQTIEAAADGGDQRELLVALRTRLAKALDNPNTAARDLAALSRRLHEVIRDIESLDSREGGDDVGNAAATPDERFTPEAL